MSGGPCPHSKYFLPVGEERQFNSHTVATVQDKTIHVSSQVLLFFTLWSHTASLSPENRAV